jgi:hypothetical protein
MTIRRIGRHLVLAALAAAVVDTTTARVGRANAPTGRYVVSGGTVADTKTKLIWDQTFSPTTMVEPDALTYCMNDTNGGGSGWRLPSVGELETLVDDTRYSPSIDPAFPGTVSDYYWTQSPYSVFAGVFSWAVSFEYGLATVFNQDKQLSYVRCVRDMP